MTIHRFASRGVAAAIVGAVAATTFAVVPTVSAASSTSAPSAVEPSAEAEAARVARACERVPNLTTRTENVLARIQGDEETRGSLLWLDRRIENALAEEREQLAEALQNRRDVREATIPLLEQRLVTLAEIADICADAGN